MSLPQTLDEVAAEFEAIDEFGGPEAKFERLGLINRLGEALQPMPPALKVDENQVPGCASKVWVYPLGSSTGERLRFYADSNTAITKGIIALILMAVQDKSARQVLATDIEKQLEPLGLQQHFSSLRTSGLKNMILKIQDTAKRLSA